MPTLRLISGLLPILASLPSFLLAAPETQADRAEPDLKTFVRGKVADFHERRIQRLSTLQLDRVLARKNPYLLKAKSLDTPRKLVTELLDSHLTPQEAGIFGSVMEQLALEVCRRNYGGRKSAVEDIDMEFERGGSHYLVSIKSGPNWGNSSQIAKMRDYFRKAKKTLGTNTSKAAKVIAELGCLNVAFDRCDSLFKNASLFELSLCLSRACLGKMIIFSIEWRKKMSFLTLKRSAASQPSRLLNMAPLLKPVLKTFSPVSAQVFCESHSTRSRAN